MHPLIDQQTVNIIGGPKALGSYAKPVTFLAGGTIRPALQRGVIINSNTLVDKTQHKPHLFGTLQEIGVPTPRFVPAEKLLNKGRLDVTEYEREFGTETTVFANGQASRTVANYADLISVERLTQDWTKTVVYEKINDYMYRAVITATRVAGVTYKNVRRENILDVEFSNDHCSSYLNMSEVETVCTEIVKELQADFVRITVEFGSAGWYVVDVSTGLTTQTVEAAKSVIQRKVNMEARM